MAVNDLPRETVKEKMEKNTENKRHRGMPYGSLKQNYDIVLYPCLTAVYSNCLEGHLMAVYYLSKKT